MLFRDQLDGWITYQYPPTEPAALFKTTDGGRTWSCVSRPPSAQGPPDWLSAPRFFDAANGVVFGFRRTRGVSAGWFWETADAGRTWAGPSKLPALPISVAFPDRFHWFLSTSTDLFSTGDAGTSWSRTTSFDTNYWQTPIRFPDARHGFAVVTMVGRDNCPRGMSCAPASQPMFSRLIATDDAGATWRALAEPPITVGPRT